MAQCDPLYDEGVAYAERLRADGVPVDLRVYEGMIHAFFSFGLHLRQEPRSRRVRRPRRARRARRARRSADRDGARARDGHRQARSARCAARCVPRERSRRPGRAGLHRVRRGGRRRRNARNDPDPAGSRQRGRDREAGRASRRSKRTPPLPMAAYAAKTKDLIASRIIHVLSPAYLGRHRQDGVLRQRGRRADAERRDDAAQALGVLEQRVGRRAHLLDAARLRRMRRSRRATVLCGHGDRRDGLGDARQSCASDRQRRRSPRPPTRRCPCCARARCSRSSSRRFAARARRRRGWSRK